MCSRVNCTFPTNIGASRDCSTYVVTVAVIGAVNTSNMKQARVAGAAAMLQFCNLPLEAGLRWALVSIELSYYLIFILFQTE